MRTILALVCSLTLLVGATDAPTCTLADNAHWLADSLKEMETIQSGMTRRDLLKVFRPAGGISRVGSFKGVYVYRDSPFIKVDVEFAAPTGTAASGAPESQEDVITSISRPYLAQAAYD